MSQEQRSYSGHLQKSARFRKRIFWIDAKRMCVQPSSLRAWLDSLQLKMLKNQGLRIAFSTISWCIDCQLPHCSSHTVTAQEPPCIQPTDRCCRRHISLSIHNKDRSHHNPQQLEAHTHLPMQLPDMRCLSLPDLRKCPPHDLCILPHAHLHPISTQRHCVILKGP